jgi:N utilization substance protein A
MERSRILNLLGVPSWCCRYDYSDEELAENERLADTEQADVQAEAFDTEADENEAAGTENDAADSGDEQ